MPETQSSKDKVLRLYSPAGGEPVIYRWPLQTQEGYDESHELIESMRWVCHDFPDLRVAVENYILEDLDLTSYESMNQTCNKFNRAVENIRKLWSGREPPKCIGENPSRDLLKHIMIQVYNRSIPNPDKLNAYEPFSPQVYGESSYDLVSDIVEELRINEDDVFLDLGSGVGNVVLHVTAATGCTCYGVEISDVPAKYSKQMEDEFVQWMDWYGKSYGDFEFFRGDFLSKEYQKYFKKATIIFVNNFAFGPELNHKLKDIFSGLKEGTRIVSSLEFAPTNFKITRRTLSDLGSILSVVKLNSMEGNVSWTDKPVSYYLHTIDRTKLEKYFHQEKHCKSRGYDSMEKFDSRTRRINQRKFLVRKAKTRAKHSTHDSFSSDLDDSQSASEMSATDSEESLNDINRSTRHQTLDDLVDSYRQQVITFMDEMQTDQFKQHVLQQIEIEKERKREQLQQINKIENQIQTTLRNGGNAIRQAMIEFGITDHTPTGLSNGARAMLNDNRKLKEEAKRLELELKQLEDEHKNLIIKCRSSVGEDKFIPIMKKIEKCLCSTSANSANYHKLLLSPTKTVKAGSTKPHSKQSAPLKIDTTGSTNKKNKKKIPEPIIVDSNNTNKKVRRSRKLKISKDYNCNAPSTVNQQIYSIQDSTTITSNIEAITITSPTTASTTTYEQITTLLSSPPIPPTPPTNPITPTPTPTPIHIPNNLITPTYIPTNPTITPTPTTTNLTTTPTPNNLTTTPIPTNLTTTPTPSNLTTTPTHTPTNPIIPTPTTTPTNLTHTPANLTPTTTPTLDLNISPSTYPSAMETTSTSINLMDMNTRTEIRPSLLKSPIYGPSAFSIQATTQPKTQSSQTLLDIEMISHIAKSSIESKNDSNTPIKNELHTSQNSSFAKNISKNIDLKISNESPLILTNSATLSPKMTYIETSPQPKTKNDRSKLSPRPEIKSPSTVKKRKTDKTTSKTNEQLLYTPPSTTASKFSIDFITRKTPKDPNGRPEKDVLPQTTSLIPHPSSMSTPPQNVDTSSKPELSPSPLIEQARAPLLPPGPTYYPIPLPYNQIYQPYLQNVENTAIPYHFYPFQVPLMNLYYHAQMQTCDKTSSPNTTNISSPSTTSPLPRHNTPVESTTDRRNTGSPVNKTHVGKNRSKSELKKSPKNLKSPNTAKHSRKKLNTHTQQSNSATNTIHVQDTTTNTTTTTTTTTTTNNNNNNNNMVETNIESDSTNPNVKIEESAD